MDYEQLLYNLQQNTFGDILERLKDIEYANPNILEQLYRYKVRSEEIHEIEIGEVIKEFKMGKMDPSSEVSRFERMTHTKGHKGLGNKHLAETIIHRMQI